MFENDRLLHLLIFSQPPLPAASRARLVQNPPLKFKKCRTFIRNIGKFAPDTQEQQTADRRMPRRFLFLANATRCPRTTRRHRREILSDSRAAGGYISCSTIGFSGGQQSDLPSAGEAGACTFPSLFLFPFQKLADSSPSRGQYLD